jgi:hypothetical protein
MRLGLLDRYAERRNRCNHAVSLGVYVCISSWPMALSDVGGITSISRVIEVAPHLRGWFGAT